MAWSATNPMNYKNIPIQVIDPKKDLY